MYYHGWPSSRLQARLAHHLARERGLRLVAMDRPGMGKSSFEPGRTLATWPKLMADFADSLGMGKFGQLGISGGGPYVLACAAEIPDRLTGSVVLAGAVPLSESRTGLRGLHPIYRLLIPMRRLPSGVFTGLFQTAALATHWHPAWPPLSWLLRTLAAEDRAVLLAVPEVWEVITESFREGVWKNGGSGVMADAEIYFQPLCMDLGSVTHRVRYWHGEDDRNIPASLVRGFAEGFGGAELILEADLGHFSLVIHKAAEALDYLVACAVEASD